MNSSFKMTSTGQAASSGALPEAALQSGRPSVNSQLHAVNMVSREFTDGSYRALAAMQSAGANVDAMLPPLAGPASSSASASVSGTTDVSEQAKMAEGLREAVSMYMTSHHV